MTDSALASRIIEDDWTRSVYLSCLATEQRKINWKNRYADGNSPGQVEARAWDQTKAAVKRMAERACA